MLINVKMPTTVGSLTFMSMINFIVEHIFFSNLGARWINKKTRQAYSTRYGHRKISSVLCSLLSKLLYYVTYMYFDLEVYGHLSIYITVQLISMRNEYT